MNDKIEKEKALPNYFLLFIYKYRLYRFRSSNTNVMRFEPTVTTTYLKYFITIIT